MSDAGLAVPMLGSNANLTYTQMHSLATYLPKELFFGGAVTEATMSMLRRGPERSVIDRYIGALKSVGLRPEVGTLLVYDATWIVIDALRKLGPDAKASQIRQYIADLHGWVGVHGSYDFRAVPQRGIDASGVVISRWAPDKDTWVPASKIGGIPL
jgi:branched-chain amino acid transport system substrate-binding protein